MQEDRTGDEWLGVTDRPLNAGALHDWAIRPDCGAVVLFSGTVRDHAVENGLERTGVQFLEYEAYAGEVVPRLRVIADEARVRWPDLGRIALIHRVGRVDLGESSVLAVVSAPHRPEAFAAARFCIDALKASAPIWKKEVWDGGSDWGLGARTIDEAGNVPTVSEVRS
ncbi:MAG: molybdenum cofactor biosynthesis protein MoaE [Actinomycetota bacterium]